MERPQSLEEILEARGKLEREHPGHFVLLTYDDLNQACYTSFHCCYRSRLDGEKNKDGEAENFEVRLGNYLHLVRDASFEKTCAFGFWLADAAFADWLKIQRDPYSGFDSCVEFLIVPVAQPLPALAAFPNGYFESSWGPVEIYGALMHLSRHYGCSPLAIGATYLLAQREEPLGQEEALRLAGDLGALYNVSDADRSEWLEQVLPAVIGTRFLVLPYGDGP